MQKQHFAELRQTLCLYIHVVVLLRCLQKMGKVVAKLESEGQSCPTLLRTHGLVAM